MPTLLQQREQARRLARESQRASVRERLREVLRQYLPGQPVWVFGSLVQPGHFHSRSDVDLAIDQLPGELSIYTLTSLLEEELGRPVDVIWLPESRLRERILQESERWIP